jgi:glycine cleavage system H protein
LRNHGHWQSRQLPGYLSASAACAAAEQANRAGFQMSTTKYTADHEWVRIDSADAVTIGITHYAQEHLGDIVFVQLPEVGRRFKKGEEAVVIESVKAAADIKAPIAGEIVAVNETLADAPETVNSDPLGTGWFLKIKPDDPAQLADLLDEDAYERLTG